MSVERDCYELVDGIHSKFWTVEVVGNHYLATFGRIGTQGQTQVKTFSSSFDAKCKANDMCREKRLKGYVQVESDTHPGAKPALLASLAGEYAEMVSVRAVGVDVVMSGKRAAIID